MKCFAFSLAIVLAVAFSCMVSAGERRERPSEGVLKVGDPAPDFSLKTTDGKESVALSALQGQQPVVLVFASYT